MLAATLLVLTTLTSAPLDAALATSAGAPVRISAFRGKPVVLFYEDRDSTHLNRALKDALFRRGRAEGLLDAVRVVAVANVKAFDWFPARSFAEAGIRDAEAAAGVPVLADWKGALCAPPWSLPAQGSTVLLLDASGRALFLRSGVLDAAATETLLALVRAELAQVGTAAAAVGAAAPGR